MQAIHLLYYSAHIAPIKRRQGLLWKKGDPLGIVLGTLGQLRRCDVRYLPLGTLGTNEIEDRGKCQVWDIGGM